MNGDFYRVVQGGPGCPYLEYVDAERCPADVDVKDLPRCEDKCLEGDYCRGTGSGKERCGASDAKPQCDGEAVYRVTSTIDMAREGCDDGPDDGPGFEFDDDATDCPFPCPARNEECPALEPLPADECPPILLLPPLIVVGQVAPRGAAVAADVEPGRREGVAPRPRRAARVPGR